LGCQNIAWRTPHIATKGKNFWVAKTLLGEHLTLQQREKIFGLPKHCLANTSHCNKGKKFLGCQNIAWRTPHIATKGKIFWVAKTLLGEHLTLQVPNPVQSLVFTLLKGVVLDHIVGPTHPANGKTHLVDTVMSPTCPRDCTLSAMCWFCSMCAEFGDHGRIVGIARVPRRLAVSSCANNLVGTVLQWGLGHETALSLHHLSISTLLHHALTVQSVS